MRPELVENDIQAKQLSFDTSRLLVEQEITVMAPVRMSCTVISDATLTPMSVMGRRI